MMPDPNLSRLILASASPRRRELLKTLGVDFTVEAPKIDEMPFPEEEPLAYALRMAKEKATAVTADSQSTIIAADTIVVHNSTILGKPTNKDHATQMLSALSGKTHEVITAVSIRRGLKNVLFSVSTKVEFRILTMEEIHAYIATGCPMDKAGAYAIQGGAAHMVKAICGSYTNVVGLPLCELHQELFSF